MSKGLAFLLLRLHRQSSVPFFISSANCSANRIITRCGPARSMVAVMSTATPSKVARKSPYIGTHDNTFHCDDVTACFMLKQLDRFKDHEIVRTRNQQLLDNAEVVVDVGNVFDKDSLRLDHHQRSFQMTIHDFHPKLKVTNPSNPPRLSSSGLVFAILGKDVISKILNLANTYEELAEKDKPAVDAIYDKSYIEFFEEIDAIDNGVEVASGENLVYNYHITSGISSRVGRLNPLGNPTPELRLKQFYKAMDLVGAEIIEGIKFLADFWWPNRQRIREFVLKRKELDPSGQIVLLEQGALGSVGWKSALFDIEQELGAEGEIKFIIYTDGSEASPWRATGVPASLKSFQTRVPLKEEWRGKRDAELAACSGIPDATFVHMGGFTGGTKSLEGIKKMVRISLGLE